MKYVVLSALVFLGGALAQDAAVSQRAVRGRVIDAQSGAGVSAAKLQVMLGRTGPGPNGTEAVEADAQGRFVFEAPAGEATVRVDEPGYEPFQSGLLVSALDDVEGVTIELRRMGVITGRVVDEEGEPVADCRVMTIERRDGKDGVVYRPTRNFNSFNARTDDRGIYRVWGLEAGEYTVAILPRPEPGADGVTLYEHRASFYGGVDAPGEALWVNLAWGQVLEGVDLEMEPAPETVLVGQVEFENPEVDCTACSLELTRKDLGSAMYGWERPRASREGVFQLVGLPPGLYEARVDVFNTTDREQSLSGSADFFLNPGEASKVTIEARAARAIRGRVVLRDPPADIVGPDAEPWSVTLEVERGEGVAFFVGSRIARVSESGLVGEFELSTPPGECRIGARFPFERRGYLASISVDGRPAVDQTFSVGNDDVENVEVVFAFDTGSVTGVVGEPQAAPEPGLIPRPIGVMLIPAGEQPSALDVHGGRVGDGGQFTIPGVPPGEYLAFPSVTSRFGGRGEITQVPPGAKRVVVRANETTEIALDKP